MGTKTSSRVHPVPTEQATPEVSQLYGQIKKKMQTVPNIFKNMGHSAPVLQGYLALSDAAERTSLSPALREKICLTVSQANNCPYCLAAHTILARNAGVAHPDILQARQGIASHPKEKAILTFVKCVVDQRGNVSDTDIQNLKNAGVTDQELVEIILITQVNMFTNYFNLITGTELDFPAAPPLK
jgi:uncharacterized peroxidase-related enzyme